ncbi:DNA topoisomerase [Chitinophaga cymbidii]|uniref:DNA topoisomerase n=2 Tax=Chitinophaga cymbidii TaxID=1096750 RepID=A0A512RH24_9BACT|nr:DNA topoisomerase [Chitinophaga cymbidii]
MAEPALAVAADPVTVAQAVKLRYVSAAGRGYTRMKNGKGMYYLDASGKKIMDEAVLERIRKLVLPPAWENVWICPYENGHLQATGIDALGRRQYRYHARWAAVRNETKYYRLLQFGKMLPRIRKQINKDLRRKTLDKPRVIAIALRVMEETLMRVGNAAYEKKYHSYGLTTLHNSHVKINGNEVFFKFRGKKGVVQKIALRHASLARLLKKVRDIPGQELFQYYEADEVRSLDSGEVNEYLKACTNEEFTCKDFRTWAGTLHALHLLAGCETCETQAQRKKNVVDVIDRVAEKLGNTRAVCRKYYVHPCLIQLYESDSLKNYTAAGTDEKVLMKILRDQHKKK